MQKQQPLRTTNPTWKIRTETTHIKIREYIDRCIQQKRPIDTLLLGDSMIERFKTTGAETFRRSRLNGSVNAGVGGDKIQNVLWRLHQGLLNGIAPSRVIIMIGTNNIQQDSPEAVAEGIRAIVDFIQTTYPPKKDGDKLISTVKITICSVLPRKEKEKVIKKIEQLNDQLAQLAQLSKEAKKGLEFQFVDWCKHFCIPSTANPIVYRYGCLNPDLYDDDVHLNVKGYAIFTQLLESLL